VVLGRMSLQQRLKKAEDVFTLQKEANDKFDSVMEALEVDRSKYGESFDRSLISIKEDFVRRHTLLLEESNHLFGLQASENSRNVQALKVLAAYNAEIVDQLVFMSSRISTLEQEFGIKIPPGADDASISSSQL